MKYATFLEWMGALRQPLSATYDNFQERRQRRYELVDSDVLSLIGAGRLAEARQQVKEITGIEL